MNIYIFTKSWSIETLLKNNYQQNDMIVLGHNNSAYEPYFNLTQKVKLIKIMNYSNNSLDADGKNLLQQLQLIKHYMPYFSRKMKIFFLLFSLFTLPFVIATSIIMDFYYIIWFKLHFHILQFYRNKPDLNLNFHAFFFLLLRKKINTKTPKIKYKGNLLTRLLKTKKVKEVMAICDLITIIKNQSDTKQIFTDDAKLSQKIGREISKKIKISMLMEVNPNE